MPSPPPPPADPAAAHLARAGVQRSLWLLGAVDIVAYATGVIWGDVRAVAIALGVIAITSFLFFYWFNEELRDAIAASVILFYVVLIASLANGDLRKALDNSVGKEMLTSLTAFVSVLGGFYFAGKSVEKAARRGT